MKTNLRISNTKINFKFVSLKEAQKLYLSNTGFLNGLNHYDLDYRMNKKNASLEEFKAFAISQMMEFTEREKKLVSQQIIKMEKTLEKQQLSLPFNKEIIFIKSTQKEECGSLAYTHATQIYLGEEILILVSMQSLLLSLQRICLLCRRITTVIFCLTVVLLPNPAVIQAVLLSATILLRCILMPLP